MGMKSGYWHRAGSHAWKETKNWIGWKHVIVGVLLLLIATALGFLFGQPLFPPWFPVGAVIALAGGAFLWKLLAAPHELETAASKTNAQQLAVLNKRIEESKERVAELEGRLRPRLTMRFGNEPEFQKVRVATPPNYPPEATGGEALVVLVKNESALQATGCRVEIVRVVPDVGEPLPVALEWMHATSTMCDLAPGAEAPVVLWEFVTLSGVGWAQDTPKYQVLFPVFAMKLQTVVLKLIAHCDGSPGETRHLRLDGLATVGALPIVHETDDAGYVK